MNKGQFTLVIVSVSFFIFLCFAYLYFNRGNEKVYELSINYLLIPVVIAFGLFLFELIKPLDIKKDKMVMCITKEQKVIHNLVAYDEGVPNLLREGTREVMLFNYSNRNLLNYSSEKSKIEVAELYLLRLISYRYSQHWQIDYQQSEPFFDLESYVTSEKKEATTDICRMDIKALHKVYDKNHLIQKINSDIDFVLPENTKYKSQGDEYRRLIQLKNNFITANLSIEKIAIATLPHSAGKTASLLRKKLSLPLDESYLISFDGYVLKLEIHPRRFLKWNPNTIDQTIWLLELFEYLKMSYSWEKIMDNVDKSIVKKS